MVKMHIEHDYMSDVTKADIEDFIKNKRLDKECYICGSSAWNLVGVDDRKEFTRNVLLYLENIEIFIGGHNYHNFAYRCFALICDSCSHVRIFTKDKVRQHKESQNLAHK
jgi:hypothetical protein